MPPAPPTTPQPQALLQRYKATRIGPKRPLLLAMTIAFCLAFSLPDGATYHVYAEANARILYHTLGATHLAALVRFWCTWGGSIGVALFALNNMVRWSRLVNEARTLFPSYRNGRILWPCFYCHDTAGLAFRRPLLRHGATRPTAYGPGTRQQLRALLHGPIRLAKNHHVVHCTHQTRRLGKPFSTHPRSKVLLAD